MMDLVEHQDPPAPLALVEYPVLLDKQALRDPLE